ncbi:MAG: hypothetical protein MUO72_16065 [Bacteroidales bacterium]|nr:hypothetical protein [Bacteroidales bacterium]
MKIYLTCPRCLTNYDIETIRIELDKTGELIFNPEPVCPKCSYTGEPIISDSSLEKIDDLVFSNKIKVRK